MSMAYACDRDGCDTFQRAERVQSGWLTVLEVGAGKTWHFCSHDCLLQTFAKLPPGESV